MTKERSKIEEDCINAEFNIFLKMLESRRGVGKRAIIRLLLPLYKGEITNRQKRIIQSEQKKDKSNNPHMRTRVTFNPFMVVD